MGGKKKSKSRLSQRSCFTKSLNELIQWLVANPCDLAHGDTWSNALPHVSDRVSSDVLKENWKRSGIKKACLMYKTSVEELGYKMPAEGDLESSKLRSHNDFLVRLRNAIKTQKPNEPPEGVEMEDGNAKAEARLVAYDDSSDEQEREEWKIRVPLSDGTVAKVILESDMGYPKRFDRTRFMMVPNEKGPVDNANRIKFEFLIKIHGGIVIPFGEEYDDKTIVLASDSEINNQRMFDKLQGYATTLYERRMVEELLENWLYPTSDNMSRYVWIPGQTSRAIDKANKERFDQLVAPNHEDFLKQVEVTDDIQDELVTCSQPVGFDKICEPVKPNKGLSKDCFRLNQSKEETSGLKCPWGLDIPPTMMEKVVCPLPSSQVGSADESDYQKLGARTVPVKKRKLPGLVVNKKMGLVGNSTESTPTNGNLGVKEPMEVLVSMYAGGLAERKHNEVEQMDINGDLVGEVGVIEEPTNDDDSGRLEAVGTRNGTSPVAGGSRDDEMVNLTEMQHWIEDKVFFEQSDQGDNKARLLKKVLRVLIEEFQMAEKTVGSLRKDMDRRFKDAEMVRDRARVLIQCGWNISEVMIQNLIAVITRLVKVKML